MDDKKIPLDRSPTRASAARSHSRRRSALNCAKVRAVLAGWDVTWIADQPPTVAFTAPPGTNASRWRFKYPIARTTITAFRM